jgi:hypothetical protein
MRAEEEDAWCCHEGEDSAERLTADRRYLADENSTPAAPPGAGPAAATFERRSAIFALFNALAKRVGQYCSTSFPDSLIALLNFSAYFKDNK